jgi:hypothetical protein
MIRMGKQKKDWLLLFADFARDSCRQLWRNHADSHEVDDSGSHAHSHENRELSQSSFPRWPLCASSRHGGTQGLRVLGTTADRC